jgi:N6-adenosine-specific RNA methylase IME4
MMDDLPSAHFQCILADPPWAFRTHSGKKSTPHRCAEDHYSTMSFEEMSALPVERVAAKNCALFMWVIGSHLDEAIRLAGAWGFEFKTDAFYWIKQKLIDCDQIDLFTRGAPKRLAKGVRQVIVEPRREHSRKPDCQYERVEELVGGPYLEMFARNTRPGWTAWGNQTDKFSEGAAA